MIRAPKFLAALMCLPALALAQVEPPDDAATMRPSMRHHGISPPLTEIARNPVPVALGMGQFQEEDVEELVELAEPPPRGPLPQSQVQTEARAPLAAVAGTEFEGPGTGLSGFTVTGAPPDHTLAVGPDHIVAWVNSRYAVFDKLGNPLLPGNSVAGNSLFVGLGNVCETTNRGDPILQYDRLADRWILSQFAFGAVSPIKSVADFR